MYDAFPDRVLVSPVVPALIKGGRLGQKSGAGFLAYPGGKEQGRTRISRSKTLIEPMLRGKQKFSEEQLQTRLFMPMLLEATRLLGEQVRTGCGATSIWD